MLSVACAIALSAGLSGHASAQQYTESAPPGIEYDGGTIYIEYHWPNGTIKNMTHYETTDNEAGGGTLFEIRYHGDGTFKTWTDYHWSSAQPSKVVHYLPHGNIAINVTEYDTDGSTITYQEVWLKNGTQTKLVDRANGLEVITWDDQGIISGYEKWYPSGNLAARLYPSNNPTQFQSYWDSQNYDGGGTGSHWQYRLHYSFNTYSCHGEDRTRYAFNHDTDNRCPASTKVHYNEFLTYRNAPTGGGSYDTGNAYMDRGPSGNPRPALPSDASMSYDAPEPRTMSIYYDMPEPRAMSTYHDAPEPRAVSAPASQQQQGFAADAALVADIKAYAAETYHGQEHVDRWHRVLKTLGEGEFPSLATMTSAEADTYVQNGWNRWIPVVAELRALEAWQQQQQSAQDPPQPPAQQQQGFAADAALVADIKAYAAETYHGQEHVDRWHRVLKTLGEGEFPSLATMTSAEADTYVQNGWNRWIPVVAELRALEAWQQQQSAQDPPQPPAQQQQGFAADAALVADIKAYAAETYHGQEHVDRWHRVLKTLGEGEFPSLATMTSAEADTYVQNGWNRWIPVVAELRALEAWQPEREPQRQQVAPTNATDSTAPDVPPPQQQVAPTNATDSTAPDVPPPQQQVAPTNATDSTAPDVPPPQQQVAPTNATDSTAPDVPPPQQQVAPTNATDSTAPDVPQQQVAPTNATDSTAPDVPQHIADSPLYQAVLDALDHIPQDSPLYQTFQNVHEHVIQGSYVQVSEPEQVVPPSNTTKPALPPLPPAPEAPSVSPDDPLTLSVSDAYAVEGDGLSFALTLNKPSDEAVYVYYITIDDTATTSDYGFETDMVTFGPGQVNKTVTISTFADGMEEETEKMMFEITIVDGARIGNYIGTGNIIDWAGS